MDGVVAFAFIAIWAGIWWWLAKRMKGNGRNWLVRNLAGGTAGAFAGLVVVAIALELGIIQSAADPSTGTAASPEMPNYTITKEDYRPGSPRKVEVMLPRRLTEAELAQEAAVDRDDTDVKATKTFIGFRVEGQQDGAYWANAQFTPNYEGRLIGLSAADYQKLQVIDLSDYPEMLGHWLTDGALGHVKVLYKKDGVHFIDLVFASGDRSTEEYLAKKLPDGSLRLETPENDFGEYYVVDTAGNLQGWSQNGNYLTLTPALPAI